MSYSVNNIIYASGDELRNTLRIGVFLREPVDIDALRRAAAKAAKRFPFFAVKLVRRGEEYVMEPNDAPFTFSYGKRPVRLNSAESGGHLVAFSWEDDRFFLDTTHFITDGNGVFPFIRTILYCYLGELHPGESFDTSCIDLPDGEIPEEQAEDAPYPDEPAPSGAAPLRAVPSEVFYLPGQPEGYQSMDGWTSFLFTVPQKELMSFVSGVDGSPATFISSVVYRAVDDLHPDNELPIVCGMQHQFRHALGKPKSHMCHVNIVPIVYPKSLRNADFERLNTIGRGSLILRADDDHDLITVNEHIRNEKKLREMTLADKRGYMRRYVSEAIGNNTFEVSYTGRVAWGGLDRYVSFITPYLDLTLSGGVSVEIFSRDTDFDINIMQRNGDAAMVERVYELLSLSGIRCERFRTETYGIPAIEMP